MANREIRAGLWTSPRFTALGNCEAQMLFLRLISIVVDDFGCFDGRPEVIMTRAYPVGGLHPQEHDAFAEMLRALHRVDLIVRYANAGRVFIAVPRWSHNYRWKRDFPAPPINVDLRDVKPRVKYGKASGVDWRNPEGSDDVSILLDVDGNALARQPPEWRRTGSDWGPILSVTAAAPVTAVTRPHLVTRPVTAPVTTPVTRAVTDQSHAADLTTLRPSNLTTPLPTTLPLTAESAVTEQQQSLPPTTSGNGKIVLTEAGEWRGLSDAQRVRWQDMFADMSIPDQLDRAAAWLLAHPEERSAYQARGECEAFLIRWLLREARQQKAH